MKLKFHWARHLWIDNAQWRVSPKFSSKALEWLGQNYVELELSRPRDRTLKQGTLILFYNEKVDAFGRVCVEISAAFTSWRLLPSAKEEVRPWLERTAPDQDATEVEISWLQAMKGARVLQGVGLLLIFAAIVAIGTRVPLETPCESRRYERTVALWNDLVDRFDLDLRQWSECEAIEVIDRVRRLTETFRLPLSRETWSDLDTVERFDPEGVFASYAEFLTELPFTDPPPYRRKSARVQPSIPPISPALSEETLHQALQTLTARSETIEALRVLMGRRSPCSYARLFQTPSVPCSDLKASVRFYPELYQWIALTQLDSF